MSEVELPMETPEIRRLLPHRYPMLLIDRVVELEPQKRIVALKNVTQNEPIFQGHFPDFPIFPGVLVIEAMAQAAGVLAIHHWGAGDGRLYVFAGIQKARFRRPVVPGDQLRLEIEALRFRPSHSRFEGKARVGDQVAAEATFHTALASS